MRTKSDYRHPQSRRPGAGWCSITECGTRLRAASIDWAWRSSIWTTQRNACYVEIRGSSGQKPSTSVTATLTMSYSPADTRWTLMATPSTSITGRRIARLPWLAPAFARYLNGWMLTEVANVASVRMIYESVPQCLPVYFRLPPPSCQPGIHDQKPDVQGLLRLRTGIRFSPWTHACTLR